MSDPLLRALVDLRDRQIQKARIQFSNRLSAIDRGQDDSGESQQTVMVMRWLDVFQTLEEQLDKDIAKIVKNEAIFKEMSKLRGIGPLLAAKIIAMVDIERADTVSALWRYCFPDGEMVATSEGYKPIERLSLADKVFGADGKLHEITRLVKRRYIGNLAVIRAVKMLPLRCTPEHRILTARVFGQSGKRQAQIGGWKEAKDLVKGDWLVIPRPSLPQTGILSEELAYFLGRYVGDGSTAFYKENRGRGYERGNSRISFGLKEVSKAKSMLDTAQSFGEAKLIYQDEVVHLQFGRTSVARDMRLKFGNFAHEKRIPVELFTIPTEAAQQFVCGYFDADGCYVARKDDRAHVYVANTRSKALALQIQLFCAMLGGLPGVYYQPTAGIKMIKGREVTTRDRYQVNVAGGEAPCVFGYANEGNRKAPLHVEGEGFFAVPVSEVLFEDYDGWVYDLTSDGTFVVNNVVVHNCGYGVKDGERERPVKGETLHYNIRLKTALYLVGTSFLRCGSPYRAAYDNAKRRYEETRKDWTKAHIHQAAMRKMIKLFLSHLWQRWRTLENLPVREPYVHEKLEHTTVYRPEEFGWGKSGVGD